MKVLSRCFSVLLFVAFAALSLAQTQLWSTFKSFQLPVAETAFKMAQGPDGSFYTVGTIWRGTMEISRYDGSGNLLWTRSFPFGLFGGPTGIAANSAGVVVSANVARDPLDNGGLNGALLRYDTSGNAFAPVYGPNTGFAGVALAANNDALVATTTSNLGNFSGAGYARYSPSGTHVSSQVYSTSAGAHSLGIIDTSQGITLIGALANNRFIARYSDAGTLLWDHAITIAGTSSTPAKIYSDASGNVYLFLGYDDENTGDNGTRVLKYDVSGTLLYSIDLSEAGGSGAYAVGPSGQVAVANSVSVIVQLKPTGAIDWQSTFDGTPGAAYAAAYDANGNLFIAGEASTTTGFVAMVNSSGVRQWLVNDTSPTDFSTFRDVATTPTGAVAFGQIGQDFVLSPNLGLYKVDTAGNKVWVAENGPSNATDTVNTSLTDSSGNTYVGGRSDSMPLPFEQGFLSKVDSNGTVLWSQHFGANVTDIKFHPGGGLVVADSQPLGGLVSVRRFTTAGALMWQVATADIAGQFAFYNGRELFPRDTIAIDAAGNTYVVGLSQAAHTRVLLRKIDASGNVVWTGSWDSPSSTQVYKPLDIAVSPSGLIYVALVNQTGFQEASANVLQFNTGGTLNWFKTYSQTYIESHPIALAIDSANNAYLLGENLSFNPGQAFVSKIGTDSSTLWTTNIPGLEQLPEMNDMLIDSEGNIVVGGATLTGDLFAGANYRAVVAKVNGATGASMWATLWDDPAGDFTLGKRLALDANGNVDLGGVTWNTQNARDYFVLRLTGSSGEPIWPDSGDVFRNGAAIFDSGWHLQDTLAGIGVDSNDNIYAAGTSVGPEGTYDLNVVKYSPTGSRPPLDSQFVSQSVATTMAAGQTYKVSVSFKNTGSTPWTKATGFKLEAVNPLFNSTWGMSTVSLGSSETINPGDTKTFTFSVYAPMTGGNYNFQWQMRSSTGVFGQTSTNVVVQVVKKQHAARFLSQSVNTSVHVGQTFWVQVNMENVGTNTWTAAGGYSLRPVPGHPTWGVTSVPVNGTVLPGQNTSFIFVATAPGTPGQYSMEWQMYRTSSFFNGFFGDRTPIKTITVLP